MALNDYDILPRPCTPNGLITDDSSTDEELSAQDIYVLKLTKKLRILHWTITAQTVAIVLAFLVFAFRGNRFTAQPERDKCGQLVYSPVQDAIEYETRFFDESVDRFASIYSSDPSDEVDRAWDDLYNGLGPAQISLAEAERLPNRTVPIPASPDHYIMLPTVLHQLHCLNVLRMVLHRDYYADPVTGDVGKVFYEQIPDHVGHCINTLREAVMCSADISPIVWQWDDNKQKSVVNLDIPHTCRKWEPIAAWGREHRLQHEFDTTVHVVDHR
ncbi:hypothetical protein EIP86_005317 [Pleurotus ostreatoroseus]|nr:hypothetical protein EIP86_005317 [Pleurotus ostreatoroseus]